jgi:peptide chain release factor subunit 1
MIDRQLRHLAELGVSEQHPFLTLYIDTNRNDEGQRERIRLFLKQETQRIRSEIGGNGHHELVERGIRQIEDYISNDLADDTRGVALFSRPGDNFFLPIQLPVKVDPLLKIASRPHLKQLARLRHHHPTVAVALVDAKTARISKLQFSRLVDEIDLENSEVPRKHDQGGWSQSNIQRHVQDHIDRHHKEAAEALARLVEKQHIRSIVLAGQDRNVANFRGYLPKHVDELVVGTLHLDIRSNEAETVDAVEKAVAAHRSSSAVALLEQLQDAASHGRGAVGPGAVADAVNQRKLQQLFLTLAAEQSGWRCTACGILGESIPLGCPACGAAVMSVDLIDEFIAAAQQEGADVFFVERASSLDRHHGVGALLRF